MTSFTDGPARGQTLAIARTPVFLRLVQNAGGEWDALDQPDDQPTLDESLHAYQIDGEPMRGFWDGKGKDGRRTGGPFVLVSYRHVTDQPDQATMRDPTRWQAWCESRPEARP